MLSDNRLKSLEFKIKAAFYALFKIFLRKGRPNLCPLDGKKLKSVLFLRPDRLGDTICSLPLIDAVKKHFPHIRIGVLASTKNISLIKSDPRFARVFIYRRNILRDIKELLEISRENFDCVVDLLADDSTTALFISQLCTKNRARIGVWKRKFAVYYDYNYPYNPGSTDHIVTVNLKLLEAFGGQTDDSDGFSPPYIESTAFEKADQYIASLPGEENSLNIGFNLSVRLPNRIWGFEKSKRLIEMILETNSDCRVILVTAPPDRHRGDELEQEFRKRVYQVPSGCSITEASAIISRLDIMISADTSLIHIARAFEVPVVGLYPEFSGVYRQWRPFGQDGGLVLSKGGDDIFNITPAMVLESFMDLLEKQKTAVK